MAIRSCLLLPGEPRASAFRERSGTTVRVIEIIIILASFCKKSPSLQSLIAVMDQCFFLVEPQFCAARAAAELLLPQSSRPLGDATAEKEGEFVTGFATERANSSCGVRGPVLSVLAIM